MAGVLLGRTNERFPAVWLRPEVPSELADLDPLIEALAKGRTVVDVSTAPALWGRHLADTPFMAGITLPNQPLAQATRAAFYEIQDAIVSALFSSGRRPLDFFCLRVASAPEPTRMQMAIEALDEAKADGLVRFLGLEVAGAVAATVAAWQTHDAFELLVTPPLDVDSPLLAMATQRRVGIAVRGQDAAHGHVCIASVASRQDVEHAMREAVAL